MGRMNQITSHLGKVYKEQKHAEKELANARAQFFAAANLELSKVPLARKTDDLPFGVADTEVWTKRYHPGWRVVEVIKGKAPTYQDRILLEEDPSCQKFIWVNEDDNMVYQRIISQGAPLVDDERMKTENPHLYLAVTVSAEEEALLDYAETHGGDLIPRTVNDYIGDNQYRWERTMIPLDQLSPEELAEVEEYFVPGPLQVKIGTPRKVKPEDL